jgi:Cu/Ag efflux protein CusF
MNRKLFVLWFAAIFVLSLIGWGGAQEKARKEQPQQPAQAGPAQPAGAVKPGEAGLKPQEAAKKPEAKPIQWRAGGLVKEMDAQAKTIAIHQETVHRNWTLKFKVSGAAAKELAIIKTGDLVNVWITGQAVTEIVKVG